MTLSIDLLGVFADAAILLALAAAVVSPRMSQVARPVTTTFAFACAWLITGVFDAIQAPRRTICVGGAVIVVSIVVIITTLHVWTQGGDDADSRPILRGGHGGGGPRSRQPDAPQLGGGDGHASWWPEFERQVALYVAECGREQRQPVVLPAEPRDACHSDRR
jgi:hypothetical protein